MIKIVLKKNTSYYLEINHNYKIKWIIQDKKFYIHLIQIPRDFVSYCTVKLVLADQILPIYCQVNGKIYNAEILNIENQKSFDGVFSSILLINLLEEYNPCILQNNPSLQKSEG
jgi:hypothetical protein